MSERMELPLPPVMLRRGERLVFHLDGQSLTVEAIEDELPAGADRKTWSRTLISAEAAQRVPAEAARFLRSDLDMALDILRRSNQR